MNNANVHREMLINVAVALGTELCQKMVFVGGCTTSLLLTDAFIHSLKNKSVILMMLI